MALFTPTSFLAQVQFYTTLSKKTSLSLAILATSSLYCLRFAGFTSEYTNVFFYNCNAVFWASYRSMRQWLQSALLAALKCCLDAYEQIFAGLVCILSPYYLRVEELMFCLLCCRYSTKWIRLLYWLRIALRLIFGYSRQKHDQWTRFLRSVL